MIAVSLVKASSKYKTDALGLMYSQRGRERNASALGFQLDATRGLWQSFGHMKLLLSLTDQSFTATKSVGIFNVSMGLARGLMQCPEVTELHILGNNECAGAFADSPPHVHLHELNRPVPKRFGRIFWDQVGLPAAIRRIAPDWALLPKGFPPYFPCLGKTRLACYLHDVIWEYYEQLDRAKSSPFPAHEMLYFRSLSKRALSAADIVLTSTQFNAQRYHAYVPHARVAVVGIGFDSPATHTAPRGKDVLFFSSSFPHKLTDLGIRRLSAWLKQLPTAPDTRIHTIGSLPPHVQLPDARWIAHGRIPHSELQQLMADSCRVAVYFSAYEGFGMPPVECLRAGLPCVASDLPPIRENIPGQYLFRNEDEANFIRTLNAAYHAPSLPPCPTYPSWQQVAQRCILAMSA